MKRPMIAALLLAGLLSNAAEAAATLVSGVQMPAWLERAGQRKPLLPGTALQSRDAIYTGAGARVQLTLPEGSVLKLGENAVFRADTLGQNDGRSSAFSGVFDVFKGAFRFTTSLLGKSRKREVDIRVATITAGIRGTDIWGKSDPDKDLVCLLEGKISVERKGEEGFATLDQPLDFFVAPKGKPSLPVAKVPLDKVVKEWAPQTELQPGQGVAQADGRWTLTLATTDNQNDALHWYDRAREAGYPAKIRPQGSKLYRVQIAQLHSEADAQALGQKLQQSIGAPELKVNGR